ncbi:MAG: IS5 family transposase [Verrucomicrobia bacterium]|nr:MAG: IS5 family transposase [Verrucomicrobiota bacterium]
MELTKEQWTLIDSLLPADRVRADGRGRPWTDRRQVFNGILWILRTGAPWKDLPERYGKYQTVHRRFQNWVRSGILERVLLALAKDLRERGGLDLSECFVDGTFVPAKKGGATLGKTKRGKGTKLMAIADGHGLPVAVRTESASPAENTLVAATLEARLIAEVPERLVGDKAYDSDGLDCELMEGFGTEMIAPHRRGRRTDTKTQDGRSLRRFRRRWKVERLFAWLSNFRRLVVRWEYHAQNFQGFVHLGCLVILLRYL